jgi:hypothetical protein
MLERGPVEMKGQRARFIEPQRGCVQQRGGQGHRLSHAAAELLMELSDQRDPHERVPRHSPRHAALSVLDIGDAVL